MRHQAIHFLSGTGDETVKLQGTTTSQQNGRGWSHPFLCQEHLVLSLSSCPRHHVSMFDHFRQPVLRNKKRSLRLLRSTSQTYLDKLLFQITNPTEGHWMAV